ncbi:MAG: ATP-binding protein, partial [Thermoanaerobaculia bacterium]
QGRFGGARSRAAIDSQALPPATEDDLRNRGVLAELGDALHPTLYGVMAFGKDPQAYPQTRTFWVECVAYDGTDRASEVLLTGEAMGRLDEQVRKAVAWVRGLGKFERYEDLKREDIPLVPPKALREAVVNAVVHRDYAITGSKVLLEVFSDRIDVTSPGLLPNHMTVESARSGGHPRSRNELMANYLLVMGLMEQRGRGWPVIRRAMKEFNATEAELIQDEGGKYVRATLWLGR